MRTLLTFCVALCVFVSYASAQESLEDIFKRKVKERVEEKKNEGVDAGLDAAEEGAKDAVKGAAKKKDKKASGDEEAAEQSEESAEAAEATPAAKAAKPTFASYSKFDFVPGDQVLLYEDFSQDAVGDFPDKWDTNGSGEVVTVSTAPGKWLKTADRSAYILPLTGTLPENFTVECDLLYVNNSGSMDYYLDLIDGVQSDEQLDALVPANGGAQIGGSRTTAHVSQWKDHQWGTISNTVDTPVLDKNAGTPVHLSVNVQKQRLRMYLNQNKIFDLPKLVPAGLKISRIRFSTGLSEDELYVSNFRVAAGAPDMRNKLLTEGRLVTHGITFDSGSDKIRPESYGTLKGIASVLKENGSLKVKVVGHTDSDGTESANMDLSRRRAEAVKAMLTKEFGIEAGRMSTEGKGQSQPIAPNTSAEGKANNRRVEFVKL